VRISLTPDGAPRRSVYRSVGTLWAAIGLTAGGAGFVVVGVTAPRRGIDVVIMAALVLLMACRMWVADIRVGPDGVKVGSLLRSRKVPWSDVERFAVMPLGRYPYVGCVVLRDGRKFGTFGLSTSAGHSEGRRLHVQRPIDELNEILAERRATGETTADIGP
jgi:hypothetical protein